MASEPAARHPPAPANLRRSTRASGRRASWRDARVDSRRLATFFATSPPFRAGVRIEAPDLQHLAPPPFPVSFVECSRRQLAQPSRSTPPTSLPIHSPVIYLVRVRGAAIRQLVFLRSASKVRSACAPHHSRGAIDPKPDRKLPPFRKLSRLRLVTRLLPHPPVPPATPPVDPASLAAVRVAATKTTMLRRTVAQGNARPPFDARARLSSAILRHFSY